jgi:hypothetical protein
VASLAFPDVLIAPARSSDIPAEDDLYGWFVGSWDLDLEVRAPNGQSFWSKGEAHAAWVLEGRAIQDVFINPRRADRAADLPKIASNWFGSTFRVYDPSLRAWRITWFNPVNASSAELTGRRVGERVMQEGRYSDGGTIRWSFSEITADSFRWLGERLDGHSWRTQVEFRGRRA